VTLAPQTSLDERYLLLRRLAFGGMGEVWEGTDVVLDRPVAVKILRAELADDDAFRRRFRAEARTAGRVPHPGIAAVFDYGETVVAGKGLAYLVMELVPGEALSAILSREGALGTDRSLDLVAQAARALHAAHERGVIHRDVKPANLMVTPDGRVKVTDFGIARPDDHEPLTATGQVMGTAHYLAPELARGRAATPASDIYALGVVMYECLAGRRPFEGDDQIGVATAHLSEEPPPLPATLSPDVRALVAAAMEKDPARRISSAEALAAAAEALRLRVQPGPAPGHATAPSAYAVGAPEGSEPAPGAAAASGALLAGGAAYAAGALGAASRDAARMDDGLAGDGFAPNGYGADGFAGNGYGGNGYAGNGYATGYAGSGYPGAGTPPGGGTGVNALQGGPASGPGRYERPATAPLPVVGGPGTGGVPGGVRRVSLPLLALVAVVVALVIGTVVVTLRSSGTEAQQKPGGSTPTPATTSTRGTARPTATAPRTSTGGGGPVFVPSTTRRPAPSPTPSSALPTTSPTPTPTGSPKSSPPPTPTPTTSTPVASASTPVPTVSVSPSLPAPPGAPGSGLAGRPVGGH
jgi:tRNA A-37 threonylcarbamoyl transferase component Bud32